MKKVAHELDQIKNCFSNCLDLPNIFSENASVLSAHSHQKKAACGQGAKKELIKERMASVINEEERQALGEIIVRFDSLLQSKGELFAVKCLCDEPQRLEAP